MTTPNPVGFLDFFVLEAGEYVEQLDGMFANAASGVPSAEAVQRIARALRGSATMAKLGPFAEVAAGMERAGRAMREGQLQWSEALRAALVAAVDDCKISLRNVRTWSDADSTRARARVAELNTHAPSRGPNTGTAVTMEGHDSYLATESANIGAGLELLATRPGDRDAAGNVLRRVRALRGIASVKDNAALAEVLEIAEHTGQSLREDAGALTAERAALLGVAATALRDIAASLRTGGTAQVVDLSALMAARDALEEREQGADRVVPIAELFYADGGETIVERASSPPTTPGERFRLEAVGHGEHLRQLVQGARAAADDTAREKARRDIRLALRSLSQSAASFEEKDVEQYLTAIAPAASQLDAGALASLESVASVLAHPESGPSSLGTRIKALAAGPSAAMTPVASSAPIIQHADMERIAPAAIDTASAALEAVPRKPSLNELLDSGISRLGTLNAAPLSAPVAVAEQPPVPIEALLYRGAGAIARGREICEVALRDGGSLTRESIAELFDLFHLALPT